jgi:hypothetical protein
MLNYYFYLLPLLLVFLCSSCGSTQSKIVETETIFYKNNIMNCSDSAILFNKNQINIFSCNVGADLIIIPIEHGVLAICKCKEFLDNNKLKNESIGM